jgi:hypothetical protein
VDPPVGGMLGRKLGKSNGIVGYWVWAGPFAVVVILNPQVLVVADPPGCIWLGRGLRPRGGRMRPPLHLRLASPLLGFPYRV